MDTIKKLIIAHTAFIINNFSYFVTGIVSIIVYNLLTKGTWL